MPATLEDRVACVAGQAGITDVDVIARSEIPHLSLRGLKKPKQSSDRFGTGSAIYNILIYIKARLLRSARNDDFPILRLPIPLAFLLLLLLLAVPGCEKKSPTQKAPEKAKPAWNGTGEGFRTSRNDRKEIEINLKETRLATIPEDYRVREIVFSANGKQVAYKAQKGDKGFVVVNNQAGKFYDTIMDSILLSFDGQRFAYHGRREGKGYLVIDGKEGKSYDDAGLDAHPRGISPDGRLLAAQVKEKGKWFIILFDWKREVFRSSGYDRSHRSPFFSPDSRLLLYELGDNEGKKIFFIADVNTGKIKKRIYDSAEDFVFTPDGSRLAYKMTKDKMTKDKMTKDKMTKDKMTKDKMTKEGRCSLVLHDFALNKEREVIFPYDLVESVSLSSAGQRIAYTARKEGKAVMVVSDWDTPSRTKESKHYDGVTPPVFNPGGSVVAFSAAEKGKTIIVVNEKEGAGYERIIPLLVFSQDGLKIAYAAMKNGKWFMVISPASEPDKVKEGAAYDMVISPVFSPDGSKLIYRARRGTQEKAERFIVIADKDGRVLKEGPICDEIWEPVFSADGKSAAYGARIGRELWWKVQALP